MSRHHRETRGAMRRRAVTAVGACSLGLLLSWGCSSTAELRIDGRENFGAVLPGFAVVETLTVHNVGGIPTTLGAIDRESLFLQEGFSLVGGTCEANLTLAPLEGSCTLDIAFSPEAMDQRQYFTDVVVSSRWIDPVNGERRFAAASFSMRGVGGQRLALLGTSTIDLGTIPLGSTVKRSDLFVTSWHSSRLELAPDSNGSYGVRPPFYLTGGSCRDGGALDYLRGCTLEIEYAPTQPGLHQQSIALPYTWFDGVTRSDALHLQLRGSTSAPN